MIRKLARFFQGIHIAFGMTGLGDNPTPAQEKKFVAMWTVIVLIMLGWAVALAYLLGK